MGCGGRPPDAHRPDAACGPPPALRRRCPCTRPASAKIQHLRVDFKRVQFSGRRLRVFAIGVRQRAPVRRLPCGGCACFPCLELARFHLVAPSHPVHRHRLSGGAARLDSCGGGQGPVQPRVHGAHARAAVSHHEHGARREPRLWPGGHLLCGVWPGVCSHAGGAGLFQPGRGAGAGQHLQQHADDWRAAGRAGVWRCRAGDAVHADFGALAHVADCGDGGV